MEVMTTSQPVIYPAAKSSGKSPAAPPSSRYSGVATEAQSLSPYTNQAKPLLAESLAAKPETGQDGAKKLEQERALTKEQAGQMTEEINKFMERLNTDIHFTLHEKTEQLMLQVVDRKNGEVIKEIPSEEMLDMIAKISEYVGVLLDKKA